MADADPPNRLDWIRGVLARHEGPLVRYVRRILGDAEAARDVVQDAFMKLCDEDRAALNGRVTAWLYTVCRRRAIDIRRKDSHMQTANETLLEARADGEPGPESVASGREESRRVDRLLAGLPDHQQEVVRLKFGGGLSYREIAEVTGLSVGNVGFLLHTALATLREQLRDS